MCVRVDLDEKDGYFAFHHDVNDGALELGSDLIVFIMREEV